MVRQLPDTSPERAGDGLKEAGLCGRVLFILINLLDFFPFCNISLIFRLGYLRFMFVELFHLNFRIDGYEIVQEIMRMDLLILKGSRS